MNNDRFPKLVEYHVPRLDDALIYLKSKKELYNFCLEHLQNLIEFRDIFIPDNPPSENEYEIISDDQLSLFKDKPIIITAINQYNEIADKWINGPAYHPSSYKWNFYYYELLKKFTNATDNEIKSKLAFDFLEHIEYIKDKDFATIDTFK